MVGPSRAELLLRMCPYNVGLLLTCCRCKQLPGVGISLPDNPTIQSGGAAMQEALPDFER
jgi:hypothetical protein